MINMHNIKPMSDGQFYRTILSANKKSADFYMTHER